MRRRPRIRAKPNLRATRWVALLHVGPYARAMTSARLVFILAVFGAALGAGGAQSAGRVDAWTQLTPQGTEVRAAVSDDACPTLEVDGVSEAMALRAAPDDDFLVRL